MSLFSSITLCHFRTLSFRMAFFYLVTTDYIFDIGLLCENSIKIQPIKKKLIYVYVRNCVEQ